VAKNSLLDGSREQTVRSYEPALFDSEQISPERNRKVKPEPDKEKDRIAKIGDDAFNKGYADGIAAGSRNVEEAAQRLGAIIGELEKFRDSKTDELLPDLIDLSIAIAKKIVHANIEKDRDNIIAIVREALSKLGGSEEKIMIRVNPDDYDTMLSNIEALRGETRLKDITIEPTDGISPGGCFIESPSGEVDARIEEMLKEISDAIATASHS
jgi:flagellar assembly protein FliH